MQFIKHVFPRFIRPLSPGRAETGNVERVRKKDGHEILSIINKTLITSNGYKI